MLSPRRVKFRKQQRADIAGVATEATHAFGQFACRPGMWLDHIPPDRSQAGRAMTRSVRRGQDLDRIFPDKPGTCALPGKQDGLRVRDRSRVLRDQKPVAPSLRWVDLEITHRQASDASGPVISLSLCQTSSIVQTKLELCCA